MQQIEFIFLRYFALHVSGATFTHHQDSQLYKRVWCNYKSFVWLGEVCARSRSAVRKV
jgi:hypothetical protein